MNEIKAHNTMSHEEQRIAIAEACGFEVTRIEYDGYGKIYRVWAVTPDSWAGKDVRPWLPDFNDLNACHEFEIWLLKNHPDLRAVYRRILIECVGSDGFYWMATAPQRCEAFLKTIGKWEGEA